MPNKYQPLTDYLRARDDDEEFVMSFAQLEAVLDFTLPDSARDHRSWWANTETQLHSQAWGAAEWFVAKVDLEKEVVIFAKLAPVSGT